MRDQLADSIREIVDRLNSPRHVSEKYGLIGTGIFWFILLICMAFVRPVQKKPKYKEVQIVLSSTPVEKKAEESPAPAAPAPTPAASSEPVEAAAPVVESKPAPVEAPKAVEKPKAAETPKAESKKSAPKKVEQPKPAAKPAEKSKPAPAPAKTEEPVIYKSVEDLMAEQLATKKSTKSADYDPFAQFDDVEDDFETETTKTVTSSAPAFSGSAATATQSSNQPVKSSSTTNKTTTQASSNATSSALGKISNAKFFGTASSSVDTEATMQTTASGNGKVSLVMDNGSSRILLEPAKPVINLTEAAAATIDGSRKVSIRFTVTESGNVPRGEISITPESILAEIVRKEIRDQISKWRFETADYVSKATFEYKIVKYMD